LSPNISNGKYDPVKLEKWIKRMEKIFAVIKVLEEKKVNIGTFHLAGEVNL